MLPAPLLFGTLVLGIVFVVVATTRWKMHPFLALLLTAYGIGLCSGLGPTQTLAALAGGFGKTVGVIGIVIACGCIIGTVLEKSGCALVMAEAVLRSIGRTRALLAMSCTGALVSIPVFCDSGFVILSSLNRSLARRTGASLAGFATALGMGLYATHCLVPPTPGPIAAAGELRADIGLVMLLGGALVVPIVVVTFLHARFIGRRVSVDSGPELEAVLDEQAAPGVFGAFLPILLPVVLIAGKAIADLPGRPLGDGPVRQVLGMVGDPNAALIVGVLSAWVVVRRRGRETFGAWCGQGLRDAGTIILITAAGGAFGGVLRETPMAKLVGDGLVSLDFGRLSILLPFLVAAGLKTAQGSSTVAMITTASLVSSLLPAMGLGEGFGPVLATLAVASGAMVVSHVNDSYFWVVVQMTGMTVSQGYKTVTVASALAGMTGLVVVVVMSFVLL